MRCLFKIIIDFMLLVIVTPRFDPKVPFSLSLGGRSKNFGKNDGCQKVCLCY